MPYIVEIGSKLRSKSFFLDFRDYPGGKTCLGKAHKRGALCPFSRALVVSCCSKVTDSK